MIPYGRQDIQQQDIDAVVEVLRSDFLTQGPAVPRFEQLVAGRVGARHAVAVNSATSALHLACLALGLGEGDLLWTVPNTFVASANCGRYCGADVDFVDIDPVTWNMSPALLGEKLRQAGSNGRLPRIVVTVHFAGQPVEQEKIWALAQEYGFKVIEDASHAIGASRAGEPVGNMRWADIVVFSFHPVKIITTGEGGMALTNDPELARRMQTLRTHGISRDPHDWHSPANALGTEVRPAAARGNWYYEQQVLGYNYRMTDIQAALGISQLGRLAEYVTRRNGLARSYDEALADLPLQLPKVLEDNRSAFHLYVVRTLAAGNAEDHRLAVFEGLRQRGIGVNVHYMPVHLQPYYRAQGFHPGQFPESEAYGRTAITLPLYPAMTEDDQLKVVKAVRESL